MKTLEKRRSGNVMPNEFRRGVQSRLGKNIKRLMKRDGLSMYEIEARTGIGHTAIWRYINGDTLPTVDKLLWLAQVQGWNLSELLGKVDVL